MVLVEQTHWTCWGIMAARLKGTDVLYGEAGDWGEAADGELPKGRPRHGDAGPNAPNPPHVGHAGRGDLSLSGDVPPLAMDGGANGAVLHEAGADELLGSKGNGIPQLAPTSRRGLQTDWQSLDTALISTLEAELAP